MSATERAARKGLPHETHANLIEALFADGLGTRGDVTEYSGRGVGMGVLREACAARGCRIAVHSDNGRGTAVQFRFPRSALRSEQEQPRRTSKRAAG